MRPTVRFASVIGAATLSVIAMAPAMAAAPVSQAGANAVTLSVAGNGQGSGDVIAKNDGSKETKTGDTAPPVGILGGEQELIRAGLLAQEATAGSNGNSAACAGLAGAGGSVVRIGETSCLTGGDGSVKLSVGTLDLSGSTVINEDSALGPLSNSEFDTVVAEVTSALSKGLTDASAELAALGLLGNLDAISSHCQAAPGTASGDANFAGVNLTLEVPGRDPVVLQRLNVRYPPNTDVFVDIDKAVDEILKAVEEDVQDSFDDALDPVQEQVLAPIREAIVNDVLSQVKGKLQPLSDNLLKLVLNRQIRTGNDQIKVRALDLDVLPAVTPQVGAPLANLQIGNTACGPNGRSAVAGPQAAPPKAKGLPTGVSAGYATMPGGNAHGDDNTTAIVLGAFALLMATGAGFVTFRRLRD